MIRYGLFFKIVSGGALVLAAAALFSSCGRTDPVKAESADLILRVAKVVSLDRSTLPGADAVAVKDGIILAVGAAEEIEARHGRAGTEHLDCAVALKQMYLFLDHELDTASDEVIRQHLTECEPCLERFDVEVVVKTLVARHCGGDAAPDTLRTKVLVQLASAKHRALNE